MPNKSITFRIWKDAEPKRWKRPSRFRFHWSMSSVGEKTKLNEEMSHYRGDKAPVGQFVSRLILACPSELWEEVRAQMDVKYDDW